MKGRVVLLLCFATAGCRTAQPTLADPPGTVYAHFLDQNYLFRPKRPERLIYEAHLAPNITLAQDIREANQALSTDSIPRWHAAQSLVLTPMFVIRQLSDSSGAVRTPSFMPKLTYQYLWLRKNLRPDTRPRDAGDPRTWRHIDGVVWDNIFGHYSNGQAGCFYNGQQFVRNAVTNDFECRPATVPAGTGINTSDGSFSTWYLRSGVGLERTWVYPYMGSIPTKRRVGVLASFQYQIPALTEAPQRPLYGDWRFRVRGEVESHDFGDKLGGTWRLATLYDRALDGSPRFTQWQWHVEAARSFTRLYGLGAFVRWHRGQDYYNIAFTDRLDVVQWGVIFNLDRPDRYAP